ncbi:MAG: hypothetical protein IPK73_30240 [Candidatus Obscuribacter sp.]|nr:hypothetical protein [Candidatus Obscuribacter sp.]
MVIAAHEVRPIPTMGIADFGKMSLALFASCVIVSIAPLWLPAVETPASLNERVVHCSGLTGTDRGTGILLSQQYALALEILGLPKDTPAKTMLNIVANRLSHAKRAGLGPAEEAAYVLGVDCGALSQDQLKKRLMLIDAVMVLHMAGDSTYRYGCAELAVPTSFLLLSPGKPG